MKQQIILHKPHYTFTILWQKKQMKRFILKFQDDTFLLTTPKQTTMEEVKAWLTQLDERQILKLCAFQKVKQTDSFVYVFGEKHHLPKKYSKKQLSQRLDETLMTYATKRLNDFYKQGLVPFEVQLQLQMMKSRYGVCFIHEKRIKLSKRLIHEPKAVIDSVIIHELGHFHYPNHSKQFYQWVYTYCPNYELYHAYLKEGGAGDDYHYLCE